MSKAPSIASKGFSLIEILIVIAIISVVAAIALPNLLRSRMSANEVAAIGSCKGILTGQTDYNNNTNPHTYSASLSGLVANGSAFVDDNLAKGLRSGYTFTVVVGKTVLIKGQPATMAFSACAWPLAYRSSGVRSFYIDETGVIRASNEGGTKGVFQMIPN